MSGLIVKNYTEADQMRWDEFVQRSKNGTFLFLRGYMEYHADRFPDASLVALDEEGAVQALLPATRNADELSSHAGLTYGGFVTDERMTVTTMLDLFEVSLQHLRQDGITTLIYKSVPHIYHRSPAEEDLYGLFRHGAELYRRDVLSVIDYGGGIDWGKRRQRRMNKARNAARAGIEVRESTEHHRFWNVLASNLERRHGIQPVHTLEELELLAKRFPERIRLFCGYRGDALEAGALLYLSEPVCHVQYGASTDNGRQLRALDLVYAHVIEAFHGQMRYFDFGISTDRDGRFLNAGLVEHKEQFGARAVAHDFYRLTM